MFKTTRFKFLAAALTLGAALPAWADTLPDLQESTFWKAEVDIGNLPPVQDRIPQEPLIVDLSSKGREFGM